MENPYIKIPTIDAYYKEKKLWFIYTDVSDQEMANQLSKIINHPIVFSSQIGKVSKEKVGKLYVFKNGISQKGKKPWGGGPFSYQSNIFDSIPGKDEYTPLREIYLVTWNEMGIPRILKSDEALSDAERRGYLKIRSTSIIVNAPIVKWPSPKKVSWWETLLKEVVLFIGQ